MNDWNVINIVKANLLLIDKSMSAFRHSNLTILNNFISNLFCRSSMNNDLWLIGIFHIQTNTHTKWQSFWMGRMEKYFKRPEWFESRITLIRIELVQSGSLWGLFSLVFMLWSFSMNFDQIYVGNRGTWRYINKGNKDDWSSPPLKWHQKYPKI